MSADQPKNLLLAGYNRKTTRIWQSHSHDRHHPSDFILPVFVVKDENAKNDIKGLPNVYQFGVNKLVEYLRPLVDLGLATVLIFPVLTDEKDKGLNNFKNEELNPAVKAIKVLKKQFPNLILSVDVCLCTFNLDGHCCTYTSDGQIDNKDTLNHLINLSRAYASVGVDILVLKTIPIAKFASSLYGPFRNAANSAPKYGDRKSYQFPIGSRSLAIRGIERDIAEGADYVIVKPGIFYLDVVKEVSTKFENTPVAVYQVSGEYTMIYAGYKEGAFDLKTIVFESMTCFKRAGASIIITYFTDSILKWIRNNEFVWESN